MVGGVTGFDFERVSLVRPVMPALLRRPISRRARAPRAVHKSFAWSSAGRIGHETSSFGNRSNCLGVFSLGVRTRARACKSSRSWPGQDGRADPFAHNGRTTAPALSGHDGGNGARPATRSRTRKNGGSVSSYPPTQSRRPNAPTMPRNTRRGSATIETGRRSLSARLACNPGQVGGKSMRLSD